MRIWEVVAALALVGFVAAAARVLQISPVVAADARRTISRPVTWLVGVPVMALILGLGLPYVETQILAGPTPKPLSFADLAPDSAGPSAKPGTAGTSVSGGVPTNLATPATTTTIAVAAASLAGPHAGPATTTAAGTPADVITGSWAIGAGTQAGYGIDDTVMGQTSRVIGRTPDVNGTMRIAPQAAGDAVVATRVVVNMQTVTCHCVHDTKYRQMLEVTRYPTATFVLTQPIGLTSVPAQGTVVSVPITGSFTIHGVTRSATFTLQATRIGNRIGVKGSIPVKLSDYNVSAPSGGSMGGLSNCTIDLLLGFDRVGG